MALFYPSAIPSEPPLSSSSSLCRRRKYEYDVYLSFSGNDTRKNFADPIYMAMKGAGIDVFRYDKELQVGESISEKLLEAIECSRISVIIFSKDSAASSWCLEEVEKILECWKTFQQPVLSIFYMVDLYCLVEAFAKHQGHFAADNLSRWREALTEAANLPGFKCIDGNREETECIQEFFKDILATLGVILLKERRDNMEIVDDGANGCQIGKLFVSDKEIALGRNGIVVYEGTYSGRPVAVKQLVKGHHVMASREIQNLIESDEHQNIVRFYGEEKDKYFVYLALEQCTCNLADLIQIYSDYPSQNTQFSDEYNKVRLDWLDSVKVIMGDINLWKANGRPSPLLLELMRDVVSGLVHLHELGIIHGDLQPQNVLIKIEEKSLRAKLSNTGIYKRLDPETSSVVCGTSGWIAPEWLLHGRETRAMDLFSLGCVLFFCTTGGRHPFGDHFERDYHIEENQVDLSAVEYIPEAVDLFSHLLNPHPELRPKASEVLHHPLFWDSEKRLSFVRDTGDRVEWEAKGTYSKDLLRALENIAPVTFDALWDTKMEREFIDNILLHRRYKFDSVRDLLRVMRNKLNHYIELPKEIQCKVQTHFTPLRSSNPNHHCDCAAADPPYRRQYHPFRYSNHPCSCASYYGLMKIDSRGQIIHFAEKPKGADLKAMQVDTTLLGLSSQDALKSPYTASMGVYVFKTDILLKLLRRRYPTSNDFGSEIIPSAVMEHNVLEILAPVSEGFDDYFASRFPRLLLKYSKLWTNIVRKRNGIRSIISCVQKRNPSCGSI